MCDKTINAHYSTIHFVPECYKTQEICDEAFNIFLRLFSNSRNV